jgi:DNA-binding PadR family transcriptional regulator
MSIPDAESHLPLSSAQFHVLAALAEGELHGYAIMQLVEESSGGVVTMGPATLYGTLRRLVDGGLAEESDRRPVEDDQRRRYYRLTGLGKRVCMAEADRLEALARRAQRNLRPGMA